MDFKKYESIPLPIVISDDKMKILFVNKETEIIFGYSKEELLDNDVKIFMVEKTKLKHDRYVDNYYGGKKPKIIGKKGKKILGETKKGEILNLLLLIDEFIIENKRIFVATFEKYNKKNLDKIKN